jgi:UDP-N-acetylmuramoyl-L-alanyl-D-glutamate--2,6-diaminopimelate ligase
MIRGLFKDETLKSRVRAEVVRLKRLRRRLKAMRHQPLSAVRILAHREIEPAQRVLEAIAAIAWFRHPSRKLQIVGVTGTNGKTTTCQLVTSILRTAGYRAAVHSSLEGYAATSFTTPNPWALQRVLRRMISEGAEIAVLEVTSHALALRRVWGLRFCAVAVTNVTRDHFDFHHTMDAYVDAKCRLFRGHPDIAVVNADDPWRARFERFPAGTRVLFGLHPDAHVTAREIDVSHPGSVSFTLVTVRGTAPVRLAATGEIAVVNALGAAAITSELGIDLQAIVRGLENCPPVPGRMEWIETGRQFGVVIDFAHSPDAMMRLYEALRPFASGRLIGVFGAGANRDQGKRPMMGDVAARWCDLIVLTSTALRSEDPQQILAHLLEGIEAADVQPASGVVVELERPKAIALALALAEPGDIVAISGLGPNTYPDAGGRRHLNDRLVVEQLLANTDVGT